MTADFISVNGFYQARNTASRKSSIFLGYISSLAPRRKKWQSDYCHTELKSTFFCSNCWVLALSRCVCAFISTSEGIRGEWVCTCVRGIVSDLERAQLGFSTCEAVGRCGLQAAEWTGPHPTEQNRGRRWHAAQQWDQKQDTSALLCCYNMPFTHQLYNL